MTVVTQDSRLLSVKTPLAPDLLLIDRVTVTESLSRLTTIDVDLLTEVSRVGEVSADELIGKKMTVSVEMVEGNTRYFNGVVTSFVESGGDLRFKSYSAQLAPWLWLLTLRANCRVFQEKSVPDILEEIFNEWSGKFSEHVDWLIDAESGFHEPLDYCVQYRETDFNFVSRLMEQDGLFYYFVHHDNGHTLIVSDKNSSFNPVPFTPKPRFAPEAGHGHDEQVVTSWDSRRSVVPGKFVQRDHHFQMPSKPLEFGQPSPIANAKADLEIYDFPGEFAQRFNAPDKRLDKVEKVGNDLTKRRIEERAVGHFLMNGTSTCAAFDPGFYFDLEGFEGEAIIEPGTQGQYLITSVRHTIEQTPNYFSGYGGGGYRNSFTCIPLEVKFHPRRRTPKPVVEGMQTAVVVGPSGEEIHTDKYGRVRVEFFWNRDGTNNEKSTCWLRVAQLMAGKQWGAHFWPRIGHEVLVAFMEGDPDQPIVVGSLYNAENMPPYTLPDHQTRSGFKSRSTKDGSSDNFNELRFEDKKGEEEIYFHAEKDFNRVVENNDTLKVGFEKKDDGDQTIEIHNNQSLTVGNAQSKDGSQTVEIWKDQTETIKTGNRDVKIEMGNDSLQIKMGNRTEKIDLGKSETEALQSIEFKVGQSSIKIDQMGVTIKGMMINIEGQMTADVKALMTTVKGDAMLTAKGGLTMIN